MESAKGMQKAYLNFIISKTEICKNSVNRLD